MKVLIITPYSPQGYDIWMPLGICYIASTLRAKNHEVIIFDRYEFRNTHSLDEVNSMMMDKIDVFSPDIIGFSTFTQMIYDTMNCIDIIRKVFDKTIVLGGHHVTAFPKLSLERIQQVDFVVTGEGEIPFAMLLDGVEKEEIPGLYWRDSETGEILKSIAKRVPLILDSIPMPAYDLLNMDFYTQRTIYTIRPFFLHVGSIISSRGCNNRCTYCTESLTFSGGVNHHSIDYALKNLELLINKYKCTGIDFLDNSFLANKKHAIEFLNALISSGLNKKCIFCMQVRACDLDDEIAILMRKAGVRKLELGLETASRETLKKVKKNISLEASQKAVEICKKYGISVQANLIYGLEGDTIETLKATAKWIKKLNVDNIKWGQLMLLPGSLLYKQKANEAIERMEWTKESLSAFFTEDHVSNMTIEQVEDFKINILKPLRKFIHHRGILRCNTFLAIIQYYYKKITGKIN